MTRSGIEHRSPGLLANTPTIMPMSGIEGSTRYIIAKVLVYSLKISEFEFQSGYCIQILTNALAKSLNLLNLSPSYGLK